MPDSPEQPRGYWTRDRELEFKLTRAEVKGFGLKVAQEKDGVSEKDRPWGGFLKFRPASLPKFFKAYWEQGLSKPWKRRLKPFSPGNVGGCAGFPPDAKLLLLEPSKRLSLQVHRRRSELWRVVKGPVTVVMGPLPKQGQPLELIDHELRAGEVIEIPCGWLHRAAASAKSWAVIAEFWVHKESSLHDSLSAEFKLETKSPPKDGASDEDDIERLDDDENRARRRAQGDYGSKSRSWRFWCIRKQADGFGLRVVQTNMTKLPWGGFIRFAPKRIKAFRDAYWQVLNPYWGHRLNGLWSSAKESRLLHASDPKLLLLEPGKRFSLHMHGRRTECWRVVEGPVVIETGTEPDHLVEHEVRAGGVVIIPPGQLHRATAPAGNWAVLAELWHHADPKHLSDKSDVIHLDDDFGRYSREEGIG